MTKSFRREEVLTMVIILLTIGHVFVACLLVVTECGRRKIWWIHRKWLKRNERACNQSSEGAIREKEEEDGGTGSSIIEITERTSLY